jgi:hypothetical protein
VSAGFESPLHHAFARTRGCKAEIDRATNSVK